MQVQTPLSGLLTAVRPGQRLGVLGDGMLCSVPVSAREKLLLWLSTVPVLGRHRVLQRAARRMERANQQVVQTFVRQLEKIYPGSPIPREVSHKLLQSPGAKLCSARGVDPALLASINQKVHAYQAVLAMTACPALERTLSAQLAICRGSSAVPGPAAF